MNDINALRERLFATLDAVKSGALDLDRARAVNEIGKTLIDSAKVEVGYLRATDGTGSKFLEPEADKPTVQLGTASVFQHRLSK